MLSIGVAEHDAMNGIIYLHGAQIFLSHARTAQ
jgi:hypothetical protein